MKWSTFAKLAWLKQLLREQVGKQSKFDENSNRFPGAFVDRHALVHGNVCLHDGVSIRKGVSITGNVVIGRGTFCNGPASIRDMNSQITIGAFCSLASDIALTTGDHPIATPSTYQTAAGKFSDVFRHGSIESAPISIGCDVWIARGCTILKGVNIGHGAIVAAGAVVTSDIPPYSIYGGVPAKLIRTRFSDTVIDWLLSIEWWNWSDEELRARKGFFALDLSQLGIDQLTQLETKFGIRRHQSNCS